MYIITFKKIINITKLSFVSLIDLYDLLMIDQYLQHDLSVIDFYY